MTGRKTQSGSTKSFPTSPKVPRTVPDLPEGPTTHPAPTQDSPNPSRTSPRVPQTVPDLPEVRPTCPGPLRGSHDSFQS